MTEASGKLWRVCDVCFHQVYGFCPHNVHVACFICEELKPMIAALHHDIEAYRGALGFSVPGDHDGKLSNGDTPTCGMCGGRDNLIATLRAELAEANNVNMEKLQ